MAIAFVIGGYFGSKLALSISQLILKRIFAVLLFYTALKMIGWDVAIGRVIKSIF
jgi:uncharacterized protein